MSLLPICGAATSPGMSWTLGASLGPRTGPGGVPNPRLPAQHIIQNKCPPFGPVLQQTSGSVPGPAPPRPSQVLSSDGQLWAHGVWTTATGEAGAMGSQRTGWPSPSPTNEQRSWGSCDRRATPVGHAEAGAGWGWGSGSDPRLGSHWPLWPHRPCPGGTGLTISCPEVVASRSHTTGSQGPFVCRPLRVSMGLFSQALLPGPSGVSRPLFSRPGGGPGPHLGGASLCEPTTFGDGPGHSRADRYTKNTDAASRSCLQSGGPSVLQGYPSTPESEHGPEYTEASASSQPQLVSGAGGEGSWKWTGTPTLKVVSSAATDPKPP